MGHKEGMWQKYFIGGCEALEEVIPRYHEKGNDVFAHD